MAGLISKFEGCLSQSVGSISVGRHKESSGPVKTTTNMSPGPTALQHKLPDIITHSQYKSKKIKVGERG